MEPSDGHDRRTRMRPASAVLLIALTSVTLLPFGQGSVATASCAAPSITNAEQLMLLPGSAVEVKGEAFAIGCQDNGSCTATLGCERCDYGPEPTPMVDIQLSLRQNGRTWPLGTADAENAQGDLGQVAWKIEVPNGVKRGWATLVPEHGQSVKVRVL